MNVVRPRPLMTGTRGGTPLARLGRRAVAFAVSSLCLGGLLSGLEVTHAAPASVAKAPLPEEVMAIHRLAKRPVAGQPRLSRSRKLRSIRPRGRGQGRSGRDPVVTCSLHHRRWARTFRCRTSDPRLRRLIGVWLDRCSC
jgi:hypothetical protein